MNQKPYLPTPKALWPLNKNSLSQETGLFLDSTKTNIPSDNGISRKSQVAFDTLHTPVGLYGSSLFAGDGDSSGRSHVILDYTGHFSGWSGISLLFWIKVENRVFDHKLILMVCDVCMYSFLHTQFFIFI